MPRECHRAPDEWREGKLADRIADQLGRELPAEVRYTLNGVKFKKKGGNDPGGWNLAYVPDSRKDGKQQAYRKFIEIAGGERNTLQAARLSTWFCALLSESDIEPWHLVTRADSRMRVPLRDGNGVPLDKRWAIGWIKELRQPRTVTYSPQADHHYQRAYFNVASVTHRRVGRAEAIRLDDVIRNRSAVRMQDLGMRSDHLWPEFDVHTGPGDLEPLNTPKFDADVLRCAKCSDGHEIHRTSLRQVPALPWHTDDPPTDYGWETFAQPLCVGHFKDHFDAIIRSWSNIVVMCDDGKLPSPEHKRAEELDEGLVSQEWIGEDPADHVEVDPLDPAQLDARTPPKRPMRIPPPEDPPEFDTAELMGVAEDLGLWEIEGAEESKMLVLWRLEGLTWDDVAKKLGVPRKTIYNWRQAMRLRHEISQKSWEMLPI
jgi:hypothetical protein